MENGQGMLADGTSFDRHSGEEHGPNGYWFRWHRLKGKSGKVDHFPASFCKFQTKYDLQLLLDSLALPQGQKWQGWFLLL